MSCCIIVVQSGTVVISRDVPRRDPTRGNGEQRFYFYLSFGQMRIPTTNVSKNILPVQRGAAG